MCVRECKCLSVCICVNAVIERAKERASLTVHLINKKFLHCQECLMVNNIKKQKKNNMELKIIKSYKPTNIFGLNYKKN